MHSTALTLPHQRCFDSLAAGILPRRSRLVADSFREHLARSNAEIRPYSVRCGGSCRKYGRIRA
ncbi:hypothetical protein CGRA01v4_14828 [Colletotrichum graminicola]|nr:hypothetical protein CGRA01v4_14828 [Colletotrichum graminicola]